jgi:hypothetical protein
MYYFNEIKFEKYYSTTTEINSSNERLLKIVNENIGELQKRYSELDMKNSILLQELRSSSQKIQSNLINQRVSVDYNIQETSPTFLELGTKYNTDSKLLILFN